MSGIIGGGGLGKIAINYGYYRYKYLVMLVAVILLDYSGADLPDRGYTSDGKAGSAAETVSSNKKQG